MREKINKYNSIYFVLKTKTRNIMDKFRGRICSQCLTSLQALKYFPMGGGGMVVSIFCPPPTTADNYNILQIYCVWETRL